LARIPWRVLPGYHHLLGNLSRFASSRSDIEDAVNLLQRRYDAAQHAENLYDLAEALELAGHAGQAKNAFAEF
jgi:hypothetical protein